MATTTMFQIELRIIIGENIFFVQKKNKKMKSPRIILHSIWNIVVVVILLYD